MTEQLLSRDVSTPSFVPSPSTVPQTGLSRGKGTKAWKKGKPQETTTTEFTASTALRRKKRINHEITRVANTQNLNELLKTINDFLPEMNGVNLVTALHRASKLVANQGQDAIRHLTEHWVFKQLHASITDHVHACAEGKMHAEMKEGHTMVYGLSVASWAFAVLRKPDLVLFEAISQAALPNLHEFKPFELANLVWGFTKLGHGSDRFFNSVAEHVVQRQIGTFGLQDICMVAWSFASSRRLNNVTNQLFSSIATEVCAHAEQATSQEIAMTFWSFAKIGYKDTSLFMCLSSTVLRKTLLWKFNPQELSNTAWAFATANIKHEELFMELAKVSVRKHGQMVPQNVANILWSFAKLQISGSAVGYLFQVLLPQDQHKIQQYKQMELTATFWAATKVQERSKQFYTFFVMVAQYITTKKSTFEVTPRVMVSLLASSCTEPQLGFFFDLLAVETAKYMVNFDATTLCCLLRGHAIASQQQVSNSSLLRQDTVQKVMVQIESRIGIMNRQHLIHIVTSLQQIEHANCDGLCDAIQQSALAQWNEFSLANFRQLVLGLSKVGCQIRSDFHDQCVQSGRLARAFGPNTRIFESPNSSTERFPEDTDTSLDLMHAPNNTSTNLDLMQSFTGNEDLDSMLLRKVNAKIGLGPHSALYEEPSGDALTISPPPGLEDCVGCMSLMDSSIGSPSSGYSSASVFGDDFVSLVNVDSTGNGTRTAGSSGVNGEYAFTEVAFQCTKFSTLQEVEKPKWRTGRARQLSQITQGRWDCSGRSQFSQEPSQDAPVKIPEPVYCPHPSHSFSTYETVQEGNIFEALAVPCRLDPASFYTSTTNSWDSKGYAEDLNSIWAPRNDEFLMRSPFAPFSGSQSMSPKSLRSGSSY